MRLRAGFSIDTLERRSLMEAETGGCSCGGCRLDGSPGSWGSYKHQKQGEAGRSRAGVAPTGFRRAAPPTF